MEYKDLLQEGVKDRVRRYVKDMDSFDPKELTAMPEEALIKNLTEGVMGAMSLLMLELIGSAAFKLEHSIKWAKAHPDAGQYNKKEV